MEAECKEFVPMHARFHAVLSYSCDTGGKIGCGMLKVLFKFEESGLTVLRDIVESFDTIQ